MSSSDRYRLGPSFRDWSKLREERAHLTLVSLTEHHDEAPCYEIHGLHTNKHRVTNHRRMKQKE